MRRILYDAAVCSALGLAPLANVFFNSSRRKRNIVFEKPNLILNMPRAPQLLNFHIFSILFFLLLGSNCHAHPSDPYSQNDIFPNDYWNHWIVSISPRQHKLASYVISAKREVEHIYELELEEIVEFISIVKEMEKTLIEIPAFAPDRFNYLQLGNKQAHLHYHVIPRYASPRQFYEMEWMDDNFGHAPIFTDYRHPQNILDAIRLEIQKHKGILNL